MQQNELYHVGVKGMRWGHRKTSSTITATGKESKTTKKVIDDHNRMSDQQFSNKYKVSKQRYAKRVEKYGDPYMNSPLAKMGKRLENSNKVSNTKILAKQEQKGPINKNYSKDDRLADQQMHGTKGVRQISKRMDKGQSHTKASIIQAGKDTTKRAAIGLLTLDVISGGAIHKAGINAVSKIMKSEMARKSVVKIAQNRKFDPTDAIFREIIG